MSPTPRSEESRQLAWAALPGWVLLVAGTVFTLALARQVVGNSHFQHDDFGHFVMLLERPFLDFVGEPIDVHFLPVHRIATWLIYQLRPLDFGFAVAVLLVFHAAALIYLYASLQLLARSRVNPPLVFLYATNLYLVVPLLWWSSGIARLPYILCAIASVYHYLRLRRAFTTGHALALLAFLLAGMASFTKGFLIPVTLVGLELCLADRTPRARLLRNLALAAALTLLSLGCFQLSRSLVEGPFSSLYFDADLLLDFGRANAKHLSTGLLAPLRVLGLSLPVGFQLAFWAALFAFTVIRRPFNLVVWAVGAAVLALNIEVVALSPRSQHFGLLVALNYRIYYELVSVVVIFLGVALHGCGPRPAEATSRPRGLRRFAQAALLVLLLAFAYSSYQQSRHLLGTLYAPTRQVKLFVERLEQGLASLRAEGRELVFVDAPVPGHVVYMFVPLRYSDLLPVFGVEARFDAEDPGAYRIEADGRLHRVSSREGGAESFAPEPGS